MYEELTHKIIGCAMKVHSTLGNGFQEVIYQRSLAIEMEKPVLSHGVIKEIALQIAISMLNISIIQVLFSGHPMD